MIWELSLIVVSGYLFYLLMHDVQYKALETFTEIVLSWQLIKLLVRHKRNEKNSFCWFLMRSRLHMLISLWCLWHYNYVTDTVNLSYIILAGFSNIAKSLLLMILLGDAPWFHNIGYLKRHFQPLPDVTGHMLNMAELVNIWLNVVHTLLWTCFTLFSPPAGVWLSLVEPGEGQTDLPLCSKWMMTLFLSKLTATCCPSLVSLSDCPCG